MYQKTTLQTEAKKTAKLLIVTLSSMIIVLLGIFFLVTNDSAQKGYALQQEKLKNEILKTENSGLNSKITDSSAFTKINEDQKTKEMLNPENKQYVTKKDNEIK
ncbi:hypothetical protein COY05_04230 [Candidatus Peregrinibacteria bacterium CG_4_10_14_0_2_um_filter_38_24]|nr:MAG: hypothetical protein COY05_04230 [Candidatus Peregrinibacteria bacterium CG_4_10_14_0_2_um_filter_38_24]PJC38527.1 MAG: hypothetical protein CO044_04540 [Candidatus Peregrinibacteria bacterium CG_4_9_14_0_2_um_filter_38_9]